MKAVRIAVALLCFASLSGAQPGAPPLLPRHDRGGAGLQVELQEPPAQHGPEIPGLTDQQKEQIKKLHLALEEKTLALRNQLGEKEARLRTLTTSKNVNSAEVEKLIDEIGQLRTQDFKAHVLNDLKIRELLTDEQRVQFDSHPRPQGPLPMMQ